MVDIWNVPDLQSRKYRILIMKSGSYTSATEYRLPYLTVVPEPVLLRQFIGCLRPSSHLHRPAVGEK